jgi:hypothetical protein
MTQEALKLALEALITITDAIYVNSQQEADAVYKANDAVKAIKEALAQPEQEPVATLFGSLPVYDTTPPQRTWVGLTDEVITQVIDSMPKKMKGFMVDWDLYEFSKVIEAKLKQVNGYAEEKNT